MPKCKVCKSKFEAKYFLQKACLEPTCLAEWSKLEREKKVKVSNKTQKSKDKKRLKELMSRGAWYQKLQRVKNQWVTKVRDVGEFCCTCPTENDVKYDAGHYIAVGKNIDLRFEETNIHKQCSQQCNVFGRGMPVEYDEFIKNKYGVGHYNWLNTKFLCHKPHPALKEVFPTWQDIEEEINKYAKILREHGITPNLRN